MSIKFKIVFISVLFLSLAFGNCYAAGLGKLPTQEQLDKYCIAVRLKIDNDIHYFSYYSIKSFDSSGLTIVYGKNRDKENFIPKEEILNFEECYAKFIKLTLELGARIR